MMLLAELGQPDTWAVNTFLVCIGIGVIISTLSFFRD